MPIYDIFSKRREEETRAVMEDVYQYDNAPLPLRSQVKRIFKEALGTRTRYYAGHTEKNDAYSTIEDIYCREVGIDGLGQRESYDSVLIALDSGSTERFLDILELGCKMIDKVVRNWHSHTQDSFEVQISADDALAEINYRLRRSGFGYQYDSEQLIRQDSTFIHDEVIRPALTLLSKTGFAGVQAEFLTAHRHYRDGEYEQSITEVAKSFESMMKAVCDKKGWGYQKGARATDLLKVLRLHSLLPDYLDASFDQLTATLSSGLPKVRNDSSAHGQGSSERQTPGFIAAYALNLAAAKIVLLGEASA